MAPTLVFDEHLVAARRLRALRKATPGADFLVDIAARELSERLQAVERHFERAVELHGYTGATARALMTSGKVGTVLRVETHEDLLDHKVAGGAVAPLEDLGLDAGSADLIVSPLSLHLTNDTPGTLIQIARALSPDGLFLAAIPGGNTLTELREALLAAESEVTGGASPRVIPFMDVRAAGQLLQRAGLALPVADVESLTVRYDTMFDLMRDLKAMGMANPLVNRSRRPLPRRVFVRAAEIYAKRFGDADGRVRATFDIIYLSGWKPHESQQKPLKPGTAEVSLARILGKERN
jgi:SAM-dependent methyltransferase